MNGNSPWAARVPPTTVWTEPAGPEGGGRGRTGLEAEGGEGDGAGGSGIS